MNLQLVYWYNLSLSKNENMFEKKSKKSNKKLRKQKQNDPKKKRKISYCGSWTLGLNE